MSDIYKIINNLGLNEAEANKLKIYLITNHKIRKELNLTLAVSCETEESKRNLFFIIFLICYRIIYKILTIIIVCDTKTKFFFLII